MVDSFCLIIINNKTAKYPTVMMKKDTDLVCKRTRLKELQKIIKRNDMSLQPKSRTVPAVIVSVVLYGCESWTVKTRGKNIDSFEP